MIIFTNLIFRQQLLRGDLAPLNIGCQDFTGPIPPSFLISLANIVVLINVAKVSGEKKIS